MLIRRIFDTCQLQSITEQIGIQPLGKRELISKRPCKLFPLGKGIACLAPSFRHLRSLRQKAQNAKYFAYSKFLKNYKSLTHQAHLRTASWIRAVRHKPTLQHDHTHRITRPFVPAITNIRYCHNEHSLRSQRQAAPEPTVSPSEANDQMSPPPFSSSPFQTLIAIGQNPWGFSTKPLRLFSHTLITFKAFIFIMFARVACIRKVWIKPSHLHKILYLIGYMSVKVWRYVWK